MVVNDIEPEDPVFKIQLSRQDITTILVDRTFKKIDKDPIQNPKQKKLKPVSNLKNGSTYKIKINS